MVSVIGCCDANCVFCSVNELEDSGLNEEGNGTDDELIETERTAIAAHLVFSCNVR